VRDWGKKSLYRQFSKELPAVTIDFKSTGLAMLKPLHEAVLSGTDFVL